MLLMMNFSVLIKRVSHVMTDSINLSFRFGVFPEILKNRTFSQGSFHSALQFLIYMNDL